MRIADNAEESGVKAWIRMIAHYGQRQGTDASTKMSRLIWTNDSFGKAANLEEAKIKVNEYEQEWPDSSRSTRSMSSMKS